MDDEALAEIERWHSAGLDARWDLIAALAEMPAHPRLDILATLDAVPGLLAEVRRLWAELDRAEKGLSAMSAILAMKG